MLRIHVLRSTWHYVHADDAQWLQELTAPRVMPIFEQQLQPLADRVDALATRSSSSSSTRHPIAPARTSPQRWPTGATNSPASS